MLKQDSKDTAVKTVTALPRIFQSATLLFALTLWIFY